MKIGLLRYRSFQQTSGPVMAKGVEDTAFYVFNRLVALNEVGGDPGRFGWSPTEFHAASAETQERWPDTMLTTSTHDSKRSGDVRCRLALLSEIPDRWATTVRRWSETTSPYRPAVLDANTEYLLYQTLVGAWPLSKERAVAYMEKASREARVHTSWIDPKPEYDDALKAFVAAALDDRSFVEALDEFVKPLVEPGRVNSLAQTLLKLTAPGVPDLYQGSEVWNLSLVDPDNRRPINYALRRRLLAECGRLSAREVLCRSREGLPKLWLIKRTLEARARRQHCFGATGAYTPLYASGSRAQHVVGFLRGGQALTVVPRLVLGLTGGARGFVVKAIASPDTWDGTALELPPGWWRNELTGQTIAGGPTQVAGLFSEFPVALLFLMDGE